MFVSMLAWKIGRARAVALEDQGHGATCMQMYEVDASKAESRALNESQQSDPLEAELIRARD
jgi:hypothetical protein